MSFAPEVFLCFGFGEILAPRCVLIYGRCDGELVFAAGPAWRVLSACSTDFFMGVKRPKVVQCQTRMMVGKGSWFSVYAFRRLYRQTDFWPNRRNLSGETHCEKMGQPFLAMKASVRRRMTLVRARHNVTAEASAKASTSVRGGAMSNLANQTADFSAQNQASRTGATGMARTALLSVRRSRRTGSSE